MHLSKEAENCITESLKIGEPEDKDREIARAQVFASLAIAEALESIATSIDDLKKDFITVEITGG